MQGLSTFECDKFQVVCEKLHGYASNSIEVCKLKYWGTLIKKIHSIGVRKKIEGYAGGTQMKKVENHWCIAQDVMKERRKTSKIAHF